MAIKTKFLGRKKFWHQPCPKFFEFEIFDWFLCFKIHKSLFLNYCVSLGSVVFKIFDREWVRFFYFSKFWKKKSYFFGIAAISKLKKILTPSLRHLKAKSIFLKNNTHKCLSTLMPSPDIKSLKRTHMGTKNNKGLNYKRSLFLVFLF